MRLQTVVADDQRELQAVDDRVDGFPVSGEIAVVVVAKRVVEVRIGQQHGCEAGLVVGSASHEAIRQPRPVRDRVARFQQIVG